MDAPWARGLIQTLLRFYPEARVEGVTREVRRAADVELRLYRPAEVRTDAALFWIHGGGYLIGRPVQSDRLCATVARELNMLVVSTSYRLGPKHPFPTPLKDCRAGWDWLQGAAGELAVDGARVVLGGESAGGGLAACLAQQLVDDGHPPAGQWLFSPMLDDRTAARNELDQQAHPIWNNRLNRAGWKAYLGAEPGHPEVPAYAAAARRQNLAGLPPTWIGVGDVDLFFAEDRDYADRLRAAGVEVTFEVAPGAPHGFETWGWRSQVARAYERRALAWLACRTAAASA